MLDNVQILKAIDDRQQRAEGRPLWISAHELFREITGTYPTNEQAAGFLQELNICQRRGLLTWQVRNQTAHPHDANCYLQRIDELALTVAGQDRARNQMVVLPHPDPGEDDGHDLSDLILRQVADAVTDEYAPDQRVTFLGEQGIPPDWLALPEETAAGDVHAALAATWRGGSEGRRLVRHFLGRWLDDQLITGPDAELRATLIEQLARQGWEVRMTDSVLVAAEPIRGVPVNAGFLRASRLHPLIEAQPRPQFLINKPDQGVFASMKAVVIRVRRLAGLGDEVIGTDPQRLDRCRWSAAGDARQGVAAAAVAGGAAAAAAEVGGTPLPRPQALRAAGADRGQAVAPPSGAAALAGARGVDAGAQAGHSTGIAFAYGQRGTGRGRRAAARCPRAGHVAHS